MKSNSEPVVKTKDLTRIYKLGNVTVYGLREVDFTAYPREIVGITGPSGSGKSTLLNMIGAIDNPTAGTITSCGIDLLKLSEKELSDYRRIKVGFIFQFYNLNPSLSVSDNIALPMVLDGVKRSKRKERVAVLLDALNIQDLKDRPVTVLSGGERQRVAVSVALSNDPPLILADEPTGELDSKNAELTMSLIVKLRDEFEKTVILVSHDQKTIQKADRIVVMQDGRIIS